MDDETPHRRRPRYSGANPRRFHEKYKELDPARYEDDVRKVVDGGKTPAGMHRPVMTHEVLDYLAPRAGDTAVDCTLGYGGHTSLLLEAVGPAGRVIALDVDPIEIARTETRLRATGVSASQLIVRRSNFAGLPRVLADLGIDGANVIFADLGVSSMQLDNPDRGFTFRESGPLDMRMNPSRGEPASKLLARIPEERLATLLQEHSDEPHAVVIARALKATPVETTGDLAFVVRNAVAADTSGGAGDPDEIETSVRRTFQTLRIEVNDEFSALDTLLRHLPSCLAPGGRVVFLSFHSGEDRRVKKALQAGLRDEVYSSVADEVVRASMAEIRANPRAGPAKLRWAVRGD